MTISTLKKLIQNSGIVKQTTFQIWESAYKLIIHGILKFLIFKPCEDKPVN